LEDIQAAWQQQQQQQQQQVPSSSSQQSSSTATAAQPVPSNKTTTNNNNNLPVNVDKKGNSETLDLTMMSSNSSSSSVQLIQQHVQFYVQEYCILLEKVGDLLVRVLTATTSSAVIPTAYANDSGVSVRAMITSRKTLLLQSIPSNSGSNNNNNSSKQSNKGNGGGGVSLTGGFSFASLSNAFKRQNTQFAFSNTWKQYPTQM